jgi:OmpA-OmpF porin, OOP family
VVLIDKVNNQEYPMKEMPDGTYEVYVKNIENHSNYTITAKKKDFVGGSLDFNIADTLERKMVGVVSLKEIHQDIVKFVFNDVYLFDLNSSKFFEQYHSRLQVLVDALKDHNVTILIEGHTDNSGGLKYNQKLSQKRADEVRQYLITHGAKPEQIITKGYGETKPLNDNSTKGLRDLNRRVTVSLVE